MHNLLWFLYTISTHLICITIENLGNVIYLHKGAYVEPKHFPNVSHELMVVLHYSPADTHPLLYCFPVTVPGYPHRECYRSPLMLVDVILLLQRSCIYIQFSQFCKGQMQSWMRVKWKFEFWYFYFLIWNEFIVIIRKTQRNFYLRP